MHFAIVSSSAIVLWVLVSAVGCATKPHYLDARPFPANYTIVAPRDETCEYTKTFSLHVCFEDTVDASTAEKIVRWHLEKYIDYLAAGWGNHDFQITMYAYTGGAPRPPFRGRDFWGRSRVLLEDGSSWIRYYPNAGVMTEQDQRRELSKVEVELAQLREREREEQERRDRQQAETERRLAELRERDSQTSNTKTDDVYLDEGITCEMYLQWDGHTLGLWDHAGRWNPIFVGIWAARRWEREQEVGVFSRDLPRYYFTVPQGTLVKVLQEIGDMSEVIVAHPFLHPFRRTQIQGKTGWVPSYWLIDRTTRNRLERERGRCQPAK